MALFRRSRVSPLPPLPLADAGRFVARVSGDVDMLVRGRAIFGIERQDHGKVVLLIALIHEGAEGDGRQSFTISMLRDTPPRRGSYEFGDMSLKTCVGMYTLITEGGRRGDYAADWGEISILMSDDRQVAGRFRFRGSGQSNFVLLAEEVEVETHGEFWAKWHDNAFGEAFPRDRSE